MIQENLPEWPDLGRPGALDEWLAYIESAAPKSILLWPADYAKELARWIRELERGDGDLPP